MKHYRDLSFHGMMKYGGMEIMLNTLIGLISQSRRGLGIGYTLEIKVS